MDAVIILKQKGRHNCRPWEIFVLKVPPMFQSSNFLVQDLKEIRMFLQEFPALLITVRN